MSDGKIKLSELRAMRKVMTPGPYARGEWAPPPGLDGLPDYRNPYRVIAESLSRGHIVSAVSQDVSVVTGCGCCSSPHASEEDANGLVATHNAADALVELAEADMAYRDASRVRAKAGARWRIASGIVARGNTAKITNPSLDERAAYAEYQRAEEAALKAHDRLDAARAKFEP